MEAISHLTKGLELLKTLPDTPERTQQELMLQITLGPALMATKAMAPRKWNKPTPGRGSCASRWGRPRSSSRCCGGCGAFYLVRAESQTARELAEQLLQPGPECPRPSFLLEAHHALGGIPVQSRRVCPGPRAPGAGDCALRSPAAPPMPSSTGMTLEWSASRYAVWILWFSWLSGPGPKEEPRGAHPGPGAVSPL